MKGNKHISEDKLLKIANVCVEQLGDSAEFLIVVLPKDPEYANSCVGSGSSASQAAFLRALADMVDTPDVEVNLELGGKTN